MKFKTSRHLTMTLVTVCLMVGCLFYVTSRPGEVAQAQTTVSDTMRVKLTLAQGLLKHLALKEFDEIGKAADALSQTTVDVQWLNTTTPRYDMFAEEFLFRLEELRAAADTGNIQAATLHYTNLIQTCVECHEVVRDGRKLAKNFDAPLSSSLQQGLLPVGTSER